MIAFMTCVLLSALAAENTTPSTAAEQEVRSVTQEIDAALKAHDGTKLAHFMA